jgi:hypothetical protein
VTARILIWNLADSKTMLAELRGHLPELPYGDAWISNEAADRFGLISLSGRLPDLAWIGELIGTEPVIGEEFDIE